MGDVNRRLDSLTFLGGTTPRFFSVPVCRWWVVVSGSHRDVSPPPSSELHELLIIQDILSLSLLPFEEAEVDHVFFCILQSAAYLLKRLHTVGLETGEG
jgi:hypothetical protein